MCFRSVTVFFQFIVKVIYWGLSWNIINCVYLLHYISLQSSSYYNIRFYEQNLWWITTSEISFKEPHHNNIRVLNYTLFLSNETCIFLIKELIVKNKEGNFNICVLKPPVPFVWHETKRQGTIHLWEQLKSLYWPSFKSISTMYKLGPCRSKDLRGPSTTDDLSTCLENCSEFKTFLCESAAGF